MATNPKADAASTSPLLTQTQLAEMLQVNRTTLSEWVASGRCPPPRIHQSRSFQRWLREDVEKWLQAGCPPVEQRRSAKKPR